ncbi:hypothetical protein P5673_016440 [Acropora cervicornis]|uniref:Uncharacterized protein n=1 Tax=Acropora cervicornis TaxID=6130 RepID=A0AAD9QG53_ACRCE|nr:hypothetical protein P5673_016440 [Acropora cervicornis]
MDGLSLPLCSGCRSEEFKSFMWKLSSNTTAGSSGVPLCITRKYEKQCQALLISLKMNSTKEKDDQQDERPPVEDAARSISGLGIKRPELGESSLQFTTPKFVGEAIALPEYDGNESSDLKA